MSTKFSTSFFYSSLLLAAFFLFQIRHTLNFAIADWGFAQYALISLLGMFFILCSLKYYHYQVVYKSNQSQTKQWEKAKEKILTMDPHDLGEVIGKLFKTKGTSRVHSTPRTNHPFYDIEMNLDEGKVIVSCLLKEQTHDVPQSYLDRLYALMRNNQVDKGAFITLGDFSYEAYEFTRDKPIHLINGEELLDSLSLSATITSKGYHHY